MSAEILMCDVCHCEAGEGDCPECHRVIADFIDFEDIDDNAAKFSSFEDEEEMCAGALTIFLLSH